MSTKPTNPKDAIGSSKLPLHLWPTTATVVGCMALLDGALKYGRSNWRPGGVRASIYFDACNRHLNAWFEGEDTVRTAACRILAMRWPAWRCWWMPRRPASWWMTGNTRVGTGRWSSA